MWVAADPSVAEPLSSIVDTPAVTPGLTGFHTVLVCLDRSRAAEAALPLASHLARLDQATVVLCHVVEPPPEASDGCATDALDWEIARHEARAYLAAIAHRLGDRGLKIEQLIVEGAPARGIATAADQLGADLVVVSRFGQGGHDEWHLGDTAQKILALARSAVLMVPPDAPEPAPRVPPRRILVTLDGSLRGESVLPAALRLARSNDADLVLAHVVADPVRTGVLQDPEDLALAQKLADRLVTRAEAYLDRVATQLRRAGGRAITAVIRAIDHREGLATLVLAHQIDLVVLTAHGAVCNPRRRFGSVAAHLLAHAGAPVLVLQDLPLPTRPAEAENAARLPPRSSDGVAAAG